MLRTQIAISPQLRGSAARLDFQIPRGRFINASGAENLVDQIRTLKKRMAADMGEGYGVGRVTYYEAPDGVHVCPGFEFHQPERSGAHPGNGRMTASE